MLRSVSRGFRLASVLPRCSVPTGGAVRAMSASWSDVPLAPPDAIFGLTTAYNADSNPKKVNLGVGAYRDDAGKPYVLPSVREAERRIFEAKMNHEYTTIGGVPEFVELSNKFTYGVDHPVITEKRLGAVQSVSGTGALRIAGEFIANFRGDGTPVYLPTPTWGNHSAVFNRSRLNVKQYRYYDPSSISLDFDGMCQDLKAIPDGSVVVLQACAFNPTGVDPSHEQWREISDILKAKRVFVLFDNAYQGFASGDPHADAFAVRHFAAEGHEIIVCQSFSKNFGLYGARVGCCSVVAADEAAAQAVESQLKMVVRPAYSNPPVHGARIVMTVLGDPELEAQWYRDCVGMADRIRDMRSTLRSALESTDTVRDWSHITSQIGMFSFTGLNKDQVASMINDYSIYMTADGRISVAGINSSNVEYVAHAMNQVTKQLVKSPSFSVCVCATSAVPTAPRDAS